MESSKDSPDNQASNRRSLSLRRKLTFSAVAVGLFFGAFELMLRAAGFQAEMRVEQMEFSFPVDDYNESAPQKYLERDDTLFWKPIPGALGHNSKGFYGPEFSQEKPAGVFRIVCLGDSCTHFGPISYPDLLRGYLQQQAPGKFEVINAACIGYTSFQGRKMYEQQVANWSPDLITVYFGWNDHWLARGLEDKNQTVAEPATLTSALDNLRLMQLARLLKSGTTDRQTDVMRVQPQDYADNLKTICQQANKLNAKVWYITAPHSLDLGIPPYLYTSGEISDPDGLIPLHQRYNEIVRKVSKEQNAVLMDMESEFDAMDKSQLFIDDHIHLSESGKTHLVKRIVNAMTDNDILEQGK